MKNILEVSNLSCSYGKTKILKNINFTLNDSEKLIIIGRNGCGKSTLLKCLCNFLNYEGSIKINGLEVKNMKSKELAKNITMLNQNEIINFDFKVKDVVGFGRYAYDNFCKKENEKIIDESLSKLNILNLKNCYMGELSGGEKQKVFISRVIAQNSKIVLLDEPNNNLDFGFYINLNQNINTWFENKIVISIIHDLNLVSILNNKVMAIKENEIYKIGNFDNDFSGEVLKNIYDFDVEKFMLSSLKKWKSRN